VVRHNTVRVHSVLQYLTPWDYHRGNPAAGITGRRNTLRVARTRRREAWGANYAAAHPAA